MKQKSQPKHYSPLTFQDNLRRLVEASGKSQRQLAELLGVTRQTIAHHMNGDSCPNVITFYTYCKYFMVDPNEMLWGVVEV